MKSIAELETEIAELEAVLRRRNLEVKLEKLKQQLVSTDGDWLLEKVPVGRENAASRAAIKCATSRKQKLSFDDAWQQIEPGLCSTRSNRSIFYYRG